MTIGTIDKTLSDKPVTASGLLDFVNRTLVPIVRSIRGDSHPNISDLAKMFTPVHVSASYSVNPWELVLVTPSSTSTLVMTLPSAVANPGAQVILKMDSANDYDVTISGSVDSPNATIKLDAAWKSYWLMSDGIEWKVVASDRPRFWKTLYELDFTQQATQAFVNGSNVIDGRTWTMANVGNCTSFGIVNGTGVQIVASATSTDYFNANRTVPIMTIPLLSGIMSNYSVQNFRMRFAIEFETTGQDADFEAAKVGIEYVTAPTTYNQQFARISTAGNIAWECTTTIAGTSTVGISQTDNPTHNLLGFIYEAPDGLEFWTGASTAGNRLEITQPRYAEWSGSSAIKKNQDPRLFLAQQTVNVSGTFTTTYKRLRVDYWGENPAPFP